MLSMPEPMLSLNMPILATYPDRMGQIRMESRWAGMPMGRMGYTGRVPDGFQLPRLVHNFIAKNMDARAPLTPTLLRILI